VNRIDKTFKRLRQGKKKAFIAYIAAGDPDMKTSAALVLALAENGADIIELGIPFSDPLADGPTIQKASQRALEAGCTVRKVLDMVKGLRKRIETPLVFMTYYNIVFNYGVSRFIKDAKKAGADGIIVPDLPMEESKELTRTADHEDFSVILLAAPTTSSERFRKISARSRGFIYYVSLTGVTGARKKLSTGLKNDVRTLKKLTGKPICVGFGVSTSSQAEDIAHSADGIIVGSAIIKVLEKHLGDRRGMIKAVGDFAGSISRAVHRVRAR